MKRETHVTIGLITSIDLILYRNVGIIPAFIGVVGSILPDFDKKAGSKHRGFSHTFLAVICIYLIFNDFSLEVAETMAVNYLMHLIADSFTVRGVPLLYPFIKKNIGLKKIRSNSKSEKIIYWLLIIILFFKIGMLINFYVN